MQLQGQITVLELRRLMVELKDKGSNVCIRFRMLGEMWHRNFTRIVLVSEKGVLIFDEDANKSTLIPDISLVMQFELDNRFQNFQPYFHYDVIPSVEFKV